MVAVVLVLVKPAGVGEAARWREDSTAVVDWGFRSCCEAFRWADVVSVSGRALVEPE